MAANTQPIFPKTPQVGGGKVITADTSYENPVTSVTLFTAGENGARIDQIKARALGDNIATVLRLFVFDGTTYMLAHEAGLPAATADATGETGSDVDILRDTGYEAMPPVPYLPAGYSLVGTVGTTVASGWMVTVFGGEY